LVGRMIVGMRDANYISERLNPMGREISDSNTPTALYWSRCNGNCPI
jgi:hypothetical protein